MTAFRGVLLDFYGTLVHEDDLVVAEICAEIRDNAHAETTIQEIARYWWQSFVPLCADARGPTFLLQRELALRSLRQTVEHFDADLDLERLIARQRDHWCRPPIFDDTHAFLKVLRHLGVNVCIVSNIDREELTAALSMHRIRDIDVVTSEDAKAYKPHPAIFEAALDRLRLRANDVLHIGDSVSNDVVGAVRLGIPVAWLNRAHKPLPEHVRPTYVLDGLQQAVPLLMGT